MLSMLFTDSFLETQAGAEQIRQNEHKSVDRFFREVFAC